jgi:hypothetical protein
MRFIILTLILAVPPLFAQEAADTLKFSHKKHVVDAGIECLDCHTNAPENNGGGKTNHPRMENCKKCHEDAITEKNCALCHSNPKNAKPFKIELHHKNFSHQDHLKRAVKCASCHRDVDKVEKATEKNLPDMDVCLSCHNDKTAPKNCRMCHAETPMKRPPSHAAAGFSDRGHGRDAVFARQQCEKCHEQDYCDRCHLGRDKRNIHKPNYQFTHGIEAGKGDKNCALCHEPERFCASCHERRK